MAAVDLEQARCLFQEGLRAREEGDLSRAEERLARALRYAPDRPSILINLAAVLIEEGRLGEAAVHCRHALDIDPADGIAWGNLAACLKAEGKLDESLGCLDRALQIDPANALNHYNRGVILASQGRHAEAVSACDRAIAICPEHGDAHYNRGVALLRLGRYQEALDSLDRAAALEAPQTGLLVSRALVLRKLRRSAEALAILDAALALDPEHSGALSERVLALLDLKHVDAALVAAERAAALAPTDSEVHNVRCLALRDAGRIEDALAAADRALALAPESVAALSNRGLVLRDLRNLDEAKVSLRRALALQADFVPALNNLGLVLRDLGRLGEAIEILDRALEVQPDDADALYSHGLVLLDLKLRDRAETSFRRLADLDPGYPYLAGRLFELSSQECAWGRRQQETAMLVAKALAGVPACEPLVLLGAADDPAAQLAAAKAFTADRYPPRPLAPFAPRARHERLRVAYLSSDFRDHAVALLTAQLFEVHDRRGFEIIGIALDRGDGSAMLARLERAFDRFIDASGMSDRAVVALCRELEIDVAVDLNGHTRGARTPILAGRAAPVQVAYLGYPGTTGAEWIDYILADDFVAPTAAWPGYSEHVVALPDCFQVNDRQRPISDGVQLRAAAGLPERGVVYCCFNGSHKLNPELFAQWMRVLAAVPGSALWLVADSGRVAANLRAEAAVHGLPADRLVFAPRAAYADHLARYRLADLCLDTLPFNGGTTTSDALWAGVPVLTCAGRSFAARMSGSLLRSAGLPDLVAHSLADYADLAIRLGSQPTALAELRTRLVRNRDTCPLFDPTRFARHVEAAYVEMAARQRRGEAPSPFRVSPLPIQSAP